MFSWPATGGKIGCFEVVECKMPPLSLYFASLPALLVLLKSLHNMELTFLLIINQERSVIWSNIQHRLKRILAEIPSHLAHDVWAVKFSFHVCSSTLLGWGYLHSISLNCRFAPPNPSDIMCRMLSYLAVISHATFESPVARHSDISNVSLSIQKLRNLIPKVEG